MRSPAALPAKIDLRITERGAFGGESDVARDSERHAAATRGAVDRRDRRFAELTLHVEQPDIEFVHQRPDLVWRASSKLDDIQTSAETLCHRARDYDRSHGIVSSRAFKRRDHAYCQPFTLCTCRALSAATAPSSCSSPDAPCTPNRQRRWASSIASCRMPNRKRGRSGSPANWRQNPKRRCARGAPPDVGLREGNGLSQFHRVNHARRIIDLAGKLAAIVGKRSNPKIFDAPPSRTATLREKPSVPGFGAAATLRKSASVDCALRMAAPWRDRYRPHWRFHRAPPSPIRFGRRAGSLRED